MKQRLVPWVFIACALLAALWLLLAHRARQPFKPFALSAKDFATLTPRAPGWKIENLPIPTRDPAEPNILSLLITRESNAAPQETTPHPGATAATPPRAEAHPESTPAGQRFHVRLVHGYNMPMCMKIKGYKVEPISDSRKEDPSGKAYPLRIQGWKLTSETGEVSHWLTTMIQADDFSPSGQDICRMPFPRVDIPDDPNWAPDGISMDDLRHPLQAVRRWHRARWNAARMDTLTFLRLKQPAWASEEQLSFVTRDFPTSSDNPDPEKRIAELHAVHIRTLGLLQDWRRKHTKR